MRELVQIDSLAEHACEQPAIERWQVLEPVSGRWSWMRIFRCCNQAMIEADLGEDSLEVPKAA